jgi:hypothetical protein
VPTSRSIRENLVSKIIWVSALLVLLLSECITMYFLAESVMYHVNSIQFYYRPLMIAMPFAVGFSTWRRMEQTIALRNLSDNERMARGVGSVVLVFYLVLATTMLQLSQPLK